MSTQELLNTLNGLSSIHEELLQLAREKQNLVTRNQVDQLMTVTAKETRAISVMEKLNEEIHRHANTCWTEMGIQPQPNATLADLLQAITRVDAKQALTDAADRLGTSVQQLKDLNDRNQILVRQSLEYIAFQIDLLTAPIDDVTYSPPTKSAAAGTPRRSFDTRA